MRLGQGAGPATCCNASAPIITIKSRTSRESGVAVAGHGPEDSSVMLSRGTPGCRAVLRVSLEAGGREPPRLRVLPLRAGRLGRALRPLPAVAGAYLSRI